MLKELIFSLKVDLAMTSGSKERSGEGIGEVLPSFQSNVISKLGYIYYDNVKVMDFTLICMNYMEYLSKLITIDDFIKKLKNYEKENSLEDIKVVVTEFYSHGLIYNDIAMQSIISSCIAIILHMKRVKSVIYFKNGKESKTTILQLKTYIVYHLFSRELNKVEAEEVGIKFKWVNFDAIRPRIEEIGLYFSKNFHENIYWLLGNRWLVNEIPIQKIIFNEDFLIDGDNLPGLRKSVGTESMSVQDITNLSYFLGGSILKDRKRLTYEGGIEVTASMGGFNEKYYAIEEEHVKDKHLIKFKVYKDHFLSKTALLNIESLDLEVLKSLEIIDIAMLFKILGLNDELKEYIGKSVTKDFFDCIGLAFGENRDVTYDCTKVDSVSLLEECIDKLENVDLVYRQPSWYNYKSKSYFNKNDDKPSKEIQETKVYRYTRKLPEGQKASEQAKLLAKKYCINLSDNLTIVDEYTRGKSTCL